MRLARHTWIALLFCALLLAGCGSSGLIGRWEKAPPPPQPTSESTLGGIFKAFADAMYPEQIEFFRDGTYAGSPGTLLSGGSYQIREGSRLRVETFYGVSVYDFSIVGDRLTLRDENGGEIVYQRVR